MSIHVWPRRGPVPATWNFSCDECRTTGPVRVGAPSGNIPPYWTKENFEAEDPYFYGKLLCKVCASRTLIGVSSIGLTGASSLKAWALVISTKTILNCSSLGAEGVTCAEKQRLFLMSDFTTKNRLSFCGNAGLG